MTKDNIIETTRGFVYREYTSKGMLYRSTLNDDPRFPEKFKLMDPDDSGLYVWNTLYEYYCERGYPIEIRLIWVWFTEFNQGAWQLAYRYRRPIDPRELVAFLGFMELYRIHDMSWEGLNLEPGREVQVYKVMQNICIEKGVNVMDVERYMKAYFAQGLTDYLRDPDPYRVGEAIAEGSLPNWSKQSVWNIIRDFLEDWDEDAGDPVEYIVSDFTGDIEAKMEREKEKEKETRKTRNPKKDKRRWGYRVPEDPNKGVGRNDLCPCGSGLKFKKCCIKPWNK